MAKKTDEPTAAPQSGEPVAPPPRVHMAGKQSPWVPGRYPLRWSDATDEQLAQWGLVRPVTQE